MNFNIKAMKKWIETPKSIWSVDDFIDFAKLANKLEGLEGEIFVDLIVLSSYDYLTIKK